MRQFCFLAALAAFGSGASLQAATALAWDISSGNVTSLGSTPRANGARFSVAVVTTVVSLGMWDEGNDGLRNSHLVQLWSDSGSLLTGATVDNTGTVVASSSGNGSWRFASITPFALAPGTYRIAVGYGSSGDDEVRFGTTVVTSIGVSYIEQAFSSGGAGTGAFPSNTNSNVLFAANLMVESAVPEPATVLLSLAGFVLLAIRARAQASLR